VSNAQLLAAWTRELDVTNLSESDARRVLSELNAKFDALTGQDLANAWYVRMLAYAILEDERTCDAAKEVRNRSSDAPKRTRASQFLDNCGQ
jgi:hypothetical protein